MTLRKNNLYRYIAVGTVVVMLCFGQVFQAHASTMTLSSETESNRLYELRAKIEYLKAFIGALREGDFSPAPTFLVVLDGNVVSVVGTIARDPQPAMVEVCGPMQKGEIDWGDGTIEAIMGLGCSGDVHQFVVQHEYAASDSYKLRVTDNASRDKTHVVAVNVAD